MCDAYAFNLAALRARDADPRAPEAHGGERECATRHTSHTRPAVEAMLAGDRGGRARTGRASSAAWIRHSLGGSLTREEFEAAA